MLILTWLHLVIIIVSKQKYISVKKIFKLSNGRLVICNNSYTENKFWDC